jgi:hypothetical protein
MIPIPLNKMGLSWRDHKSALWWLGLLYRRPAKFRESLTKLPGRKAVMSGFLLWFHSLPYIIALNIIGRLFIFGWLKFQTENHSSGLIIFHATQSVSGICLGIILGISLGLVLRTTKDMAFGIACGIAFGIAGGVAGGIAEGIAIGIARGIVGGITLGITLGIAVGVAEETVVGGARGITLGIAGGLAVGAAVGIAAGIASGAAFGIFGGLSFLFFIFRLYYYPYHLALTWTKPDRLMYSIHPVAWDDLCPIPFIGLHNLLVKYAEKKPEEGLDEIERLINNYPSQQMQALLAKVVLLARVSGRSSDLIRLNEMVAELPKGEKGFLAQTAQAREWVSEIILTQTFLNTINRPSFQEPVAQLLCSRIDNFRHSVARFHKVLAREFRAAANRWFEIAERQLVTAQNITTKKTTPQIFRAGDPVNRDLEAFVVRNSVVGELEQQITLSTGCPGLVLFGRRRVGKSSILHNLTGFLPTEVTTTFVSMQDPNMFTSRESFVRSLSVKIQEQLPAAPIAADSISDLRGFFGFLTRCNEQLEADGKRLLLAVDEYEMIDRKIGERVFETDLLDTIRESIQTHRHITWVFAGSHEITELKYADWTSYLVSTRTIEVPAFTLAETRLLLTDPVKHSTLWRNNPDQRPRFNAAFWGKGGIERIQREAGGWPHLVQLIAETVVDLINNEETREVTPELLERALDKSVERGLDVLYELMRRESFLPGEWEYLSAFRKTETQAPPDDENVAASIRRRLLIEENNGQWRLRVPLMARWLRAKEEWS